MIVVLVSRDNTCSCCGEDKLMIMSELSILDYEIAKDVGLIVEWECPECSAKNYTRVEKAGVDFYIEKQEKN